MKRASAPSRAGSRASIDSRTCRASTGAAPAELTATMSGERSTMAGKMKLESSAWSTTLTGMARARRLRHGSVDLAASDVAATTKAPPHRQAVRV